MKFLRPAFFLFWIGCMPLSTFSQVSLEEKKKVVEKVSRKLEKSYAIRSVGLEMAQTLRNNWQRGAYEHISSETEFAIQVTKDMRSIAPDLHLALVHKPTAHFKRDSISKVDQSTQIIKAWVSDKNTGYLAIKHFRFKKPLLDSEMAKLTNCDTIIVDLRGNFGGYAGMSNYLLSYFYPGKVHYSTMYNAKGRQVTKMVTKRKVGGTKLPSVPLFILIDRHTFSAAEAFSYDVQSLQRGIIIGETSAGGAHAKKNVGINKLFYLSLPNLKFKNINTQGDWEGTGVIPDIPLDVKEINENDIQKVITSATR